MKTLILGASGATGKLVVSKLIESNINVKVLIRSTAIFPEELANNMKVEIVKGNIDEFSVAQVADLIKDCDSVISCLGHNVTFKGLFRKPKKLVSGAIKKIEEAIQLTSAKYKLILMSTTAYTNKKEGERNTFGESVIFSIIKALLPPHSDNVAAGDFLLYQVSKSENLEWVAVRPDGLIDETITSEVLITDAKRRSPIFNPGKTSRINVAQFMKDLLVNDSLWKEWLFKTPVIYNKEWS